MSLTVEDAIAAAIEFETRVRELYAEAARKATDPTARKVLGVLAAEEQHHLAFLQDKRREWERSGKVTPEGLRTGLPAAPAIRAGVRRLRERLRLPEAEIRAAVETLRAAQEVEQETSAFYRQMVAGLPDAARPMFARFLEIEEGHQAIVDAELDSLQGLGFWFDFQEFSLEAQ